MIINALHLGVKGTNEEKWANIVKTKKTFLSFISFAISLFQNQKTMSKDAKQRILEGASSLY